MTELDWCTHLAALDQVGVRFEDRIDLIRRRHLFTIEHTAARLVDDARAERAIMPDLVADGVGRHGGKQVLATHRRGLLKCGFGARHHLLGNRDQRPVGRGLLRSGALTLPRRHPLNLVHAPMRSTRAIAKTRDAPQLQRLGKPAEEPREDPHNVPQQGVVGRMTNVGLHHRGVDPQLTAVLHAELHGGFNDDFVNGLERRRRQPVEAAVEGVMLGHLLVVRNR